MSKINLTQAEADMLIAMEKHCKDDQSWNYPTAGTKIEIPLISVDGKENFILDISKGKINIKKGKYQNRAHKLIVLIRLDFGGPPHRNPDGEEIPSPHLHIYREGFGDKWAYPIPNDIFSDMDEFTLKSPFCT